MKSQQTKFIVGIVALIIIVVGLGLLTNNKSVAGPSKYDEFAQCLSAKGAKFYGAFWCPHCQAQKKAFGNAKQYLPYVECSKPDKTQTQVCIDNGIQSYPTWIFADGSKLSGEVELATLAEKTSCVLPTEETK